MNTYMMISQHVSSEIAHFPDQKYDMNMVYEFNFYTWYKPSYFQDMSESNAATCKAVASLSICA